MKKNKNASKNLLARNLAGEITLAENPGEIMKKWRQIFGVSQKDLAKHIGISCSVLSDYEAGRRKSPGSAFIKKYIDALISFDEEKKGGVAEKFASEDRPDAILATREFLSPMTAREFLKLVDGRAVANESLLDESLHGYTVLDSVKAIINLSEDEFISIYGLNPKRALVFTKVRLGRSPMIAIKVTKPKPGLVVLHGLAPHEIDPLAVKIAEIEKIPLLVSMMEDEKELLEKLSQITN